MDSRNLRLAVGLKVLGYNLRTGAPEFGLNQGSVPVLVRDTLERCGFRAGCGAVFTGHSILLPVGGVYALAAIGNSAVKIGWSDNVQKRMRDLAVGMPMETLLLGVLQNATLQDEGRLHVEMDQWHRRGEWFNFTPKCREFISTRFKVTIDDATAESIGLHGGEVDG